MTPTRPGWHRCPGRCGITLPAHLLTCPQCWARVPAELRLPIDHGSTTRRPGHAAAEQLRTARQDLRDWLLEHPAAPNPDAHIAGWCEHCNAQLLWLTTDNGKKMPVNADPDPRDGNVVRAGGRAGVLGTQAAASARAAGTPLWLHHVVTCPRDHLWHTNRRKATR